VWEVKPISLSHFFDVVGTTPKHIEKYINEGVLFITPIMTPKEGCPMYVIGNAFSVNMLDNDATISFRKISLDEVRERLSHDFKSIVGHPATAQFLSELLGVEIPANREMYKMNKDDVLIVAVLGVRLPEGKVLSKEEVEQLYNEGKVVFWEVRML